MVRQARVLAQATSDLVNAMRSDAEAEIDMENSKKLLAAAKLLADSTARMVEAAKVPRATPHGGGRGGRCAGIYSTCRGDRSLQNTKSCSESVGVCNSVRLFQELFLSLRT